MNFAQSQRLKHLLSGLQIDVEMAGYTKCGFEWKNIDYLPDYNKFYYIYSGEGRLEINKKAFFPQPGQLCLMPAGVLQSYSTINANTFTKHWCHFTATIGSKNLFELFSLPYYINVKHENTVSNLFNDLNANYKKRDIPSLLKVKSILLEIIAYYVECSAKEGFGSQIINQPERIKYIIEYIEQNLAENITVNKLASLIHLHPNYFIKVFKMHTGHSPMNYVNKVRLEKAKELLSCTKMSISDIAYITGFYDVFHFSGSFKKHTGFSPTEFKALV